jgi:hypothetical protein
LGTVAPTPTLSIKFYFVGFDFDLMKQLLRYCPWVLESGSYLGVYCPSYDLRYCFLPGLFAHAFDPLTQIQVWIVGMLWGEGLSRSMQGITKRCHQVGRDLLHVEGVLSVGVRIPDVAQQVIRH